MIAQHAMTVQTKKLGKRETRLIISSLSLYTGFGIIFGQTLSRSI